MVTHDVKNEAGTEVAAPSLSDLFTNGAADAKVQNVNSSPPAPADEYELEVRNLNVWYGSFLALRNVNFGVANNKITALIGPSGCGKSTMIRCLNRMNDLIPSFRA